MVSNRNFCHTCQFLGLFQGQAPQSDGPADRLTANGQNDACRLDENLVAYSQSALPSQLIAIYRVTAAGPLQGGTRSREFQCHVHRR